MFKFNNNHIFTGYLKQLLASFHLPKCRVYTKEQENFKQQYDQNYPEIAKLRAKLREEKQQLQQVLSDITTSLTATDLPEDYTTYLTASKASITTEIQAIDSQLSAWNNGELNVIPTYYHSVYEYYPNSDTDLAPEYNPNLRYIPYIKDGCFQVYSDNQWHHCHQDFADYEHSKVHKIKGSQAAITRYSYGQKILNYTKNLKIQNTVYDSYTHEYLGDYLRFHRDFANINLMPLYNCFSNRACPHLDLTFSVGNNYKVKFKTNQAFEKTLYKYYMVPVKFFKDYTIAIDCEAGVEVCCCIYDEYQDQNTDFAELPKLTYQCFGTLKFNSPVLYSKIQNITSQLLSSSSDLCQQEDSLKLILKIPAANKSSIVILEGDYTAYNNRVAQSEAVGGSLTKTNKTVINYEHLEACDMLADKLITPLQLLRANTGESYPFADRLVEYLVGNVITTNEAIIDNVIRAKTIIGSNCNPLVASITAEDGIWEPILQCITYDYINNEKNTCDINHDILGFIDKDVEKWYSTPIFKRNRKGELEVDPTTGKPITIGKETIANVDIYE
jgi:hypothetical protein